MFSLVVGLWAVRCSHGAAMLVAAGWLAGRVPCVVVSAGTRWWRVIGCWCGTVVSGFCLRNLIFVREAQASTVDTCGGDMRLGDLHMHLRWMHAPGTHIAGPPSRSSVFTHKPYADQAHNCVLSGACYSVLSACYQRARAKTSLRGVRETRCRQAPFIKRVCSSLFCSMAARSDGRSGAVENLSIPVGSQRASTTS